QKAIRARACLSRLCKRTSIPCSPTINNSPAVTTPTTVATPTPPASPTVLASPSIDQRALAYASNFVKHVGCDSDNTNSYGYGFDSYYDTDSSYTVDSDSSYTVDSSYTIDSVGPVSFDCGDGENEYSITDAEAEWIDEIRRYYNVDLLYKLSDSEVEILYTAHHALLDWHFDLRLTAKQNKALRRVRWIAYKYRVRGEAASESTLVASMSFSYMDKDDVLDIIPQLVKEYYRVH
ncbi:hypothetical protein FBU31_005516, partial [Coemansia sp. 'formosensis']